ncbi:MAG: DUF1893 domain-containing protein [Candidatus Korarchaeota archaeon]|nr:DUF1893 domain-containing protein [Thermoproteota archaeon]MCR8463436.1 DUF1893 domain-containing protein [Thermoproteota archaeon]MCR8471230.1 DUF1893 domain-containing protein [Thermoproteota archaeon]MCR8471923.1 DUF1893 domain-containing protein [Thermoproteota archaeon]MCR8473134.1 DUF1893 domain-containing protein [Thermoproteota archaeon]
MSAKISLLRELLMEYSLVIVDLNGKILYSSREDGIKPVVEAVVVAGGLIDNNIVADRIIGKAAALIIANRRPQLVFGTVMSKGAVNLLRDLGISYSFEKLVEVIKGKTKSICPFEEFVKDINDPKEALIKIVTRYFPHLREKACEFIGSGL